MMAVIVLMVINILHTGEAVECYDIDIEECGGSCFTTVNQGKDTTQGCLPLIQSDGDTPDNFGFTITTYCNSDLCNTGHTTSLSYAVLLLVLGLLLRM